MSGANENVATEEVEAPEAKQSDVNVPAWVPSDLRGHKSLTKFKEPGDVAKAYVNLETMLGKRVEVPADDSPAEVKAAWRAKIGVPDTADGYEAPTVPDGVQVNQEILTAAKGKFHELGLTKSQAKSLTDWFIGQEVEISAQRNAAFQKSKEDGMAELTKMWGPAAPRQIALCQRFVAEVGGEDLRAALNETGAGNDPRVVAALAAAGAMMEESHLISPVNVGTSQADALAEIAKIRAARAADRKHPLNDKGNPGYKDAAKRFAELYRIAYPDMQDL